MKFPSAVGTGRLSLTENREEKLKGLNLPMKQNTGKSDWEFNENMLNAAAVFSLETKKLSCKAK